MRVQQPRHDVLPLTWEVPAAICACWLLLGGLALPAGLAATFWLVGQGWTWPEQSLAQVLSDTFSGELGDGLPTALVYGLVMACEVLVGAIAVLALVLWSHTWGPLAHHGLARRQEVTAVLGVGNLRRRRVIIRPDTRTGSSPTRASE